MLTPGSLFHHITSEFLFSYTRFYFFMQHPAFFSCLVHSATYFNVVYRSGMQHGLPVVNCRHPRIKACPTSCQSNGSSATWWGSGKFYSHSMLSMMNVWMSLCQTFQVLDPRVQSNRERNPHPGWKAGRMGNFYFVIIHVVRMCHNKWYHLK